LVSPGGGAGLAGGRLIKGRVFLFLAHDGLP
jgi:hypothetical protein